MLPGHDAHPRIRLDGAPLSSPVKSVRRNLGVSIDLTTGPTDLYVGLFEISKAGMDAQVVALLMVGPQPVVAKALAIDFELAGFCGYKFDCNLLLPIILDRSEQQLMTEAPSLLSSKPSVSETGSTAQNDPQVWNDSLSETLKLLAVSDVGHRNALLSSKPLK